MWQDGLKESSASYDDVWWRVCLGLADMKRYGVPYFGRSNAESASTKWKVMSWNRK